MINNGPGVIETDYSKALMAKPGKRLLVYLLDYLIVLVGSILLFGLFDLVGNAIPSYQSLKEQTGAAQSNLYQIVYDSHLSESTSTIDFITETEIVDEYVYGLVLASSNEESLKDVDPYTDKKMMDVESDRVYYYYHAYRSTDVYPSSFDVDSYLTAVFPNSNSYFVISTDGYFLLSEESVTLVDDYIRHGTNARGKEIYESIRADYSSSYEKAMEDLETSKRYSDASRTFEEGKDSILMVRGSFLIVGYILSCMIFLFVLPLCLRNGRTVGMKAFGMVLTDGNGQKPGIGHIFSKSVIQFLEFFSTNMIAVFVLFGTEGMYLLPLNIWGFINILYLSITSFILLIVSMFVVIFKRKNHQSLSEIISMTTMRNAREFMLEEEGKEERTNA